jgi:hypothetical protein
VCGSAEHFAGKCPDRKMPKSANMVISEGGGTSGYDNSLPTVLSVFLSPEWWIDTRSNIHVCADISMFSSYQVGGGGDWLLADGERCSCAYSCCWYGHSEVYFEKDGACEERATYPYLQEEPS